LPDIRLEPLGVQHDRGAFDCGADSVTRYLREVALQAQKAYRSATKVAVLPDAPARILGYYTLVNHRIVDEEMPEAIARELKVHNLRGGAPAVLLAQLGVDLTYRSQALGTFLLKRALLEAYHVAQHVGGIAVLVDALDQHGARWYERTADFRTLREGGTRLMLPMKTLAKAIGYKRL
jgi:GNAT superfamily N-acetyltransferase